MIRALFLIAAIAIATQSTAQEIPAQPLPAPVAQPQAAPAQGWQPAGTQMVPIRQSVAGQVFWYPGKWWRYRIQANRNPQYQPMQIQRQPVYQYRMVPQGQPIRVVPIAG